MKKKVLSLIMATTMVAGLVTGCGDSSKTASNNSSADTAAVDTSSADNTAEADTSSADNTTGDNAATESTEDITIKLFSNLPDRKNGQGLVEQMIIDEYMDANPNVSIEVEALDEEAYKTKFKAYAMDGMLDVVSIWGQPSFLDEVLDAGVLAELNENDYADYGFVSGSLEGFKRDDKLYGLPRNTDIMLFYYNQKMFEDNGWTIPSTYDELLSLADTINAAGITPVAMDGADGWVLACYLEDLLTKVNGDCRGIISDAVSNGDFSNPVFAEATQILVDSAAAGLFQTGYDSQDYGTAMNLFTNGQAAMFYMGSWEASMALNEDIPEEIRTNIRAFTMPVVKDGVGTATDIAAWNGGGYAVSATSEVKDEAIKFLNFMYQNDKLSKYGWENGVGMSAQDQSAYMTGNETELQLQILDILNGASSVSGTPINDCGPSAFKTSIETEIQSVANGTESVEDFLSTIGQSCK
ncbi:MAG: extracellular solute-binding protein [Lachnospiraceae bacterium]|nr:extracellular solute-binding protein [Lachnospiraceae bacterium]